MSINKDTVQRIINLWKPRLASHLPQLGLAKAHIQIDIVEHPEECADGERVCDGARSYRDPEAPAVTIRHDSTHFTIFVAPWTNEETIEHVLVHGLIHVAIYRRVDTDSIWQQMEGATDIAATFAELAFKRSDKHDASVDGDTD